MTIIAITPGGAGLARELGRQLSEAQVFLPERLREKDGCSYFGGSLAELLPLLFAQGTPLVCIMATGIVVRLLAPHLKGKEHDPPVVVMDEAGRFAISLLSGHLGGANRLAAKLARISGGQAVITTATDVNRLPAWDQVATDAGLLVEPVGHLKTLNRLLLEGESIALVDRQRRIAAHYRRVPGVKLYETFADAVKSSASGLVFVTHRHLPHLERQPGMLALRPRDLVLGIGCNRGTSAAEIETAVRDHLQQAFLAFGSIACIASVEAKRDETGLLQFARSHRIPVEFHSAEALNRVSAPSPPSVHALAAVGVKGVCEPAALLSAGNGPLLIRKQKSGNLTLAVAERKES